jgi:hypothetical protein
MEVGLELTTLEIFLAHNPYYRLTPSEVSLKCFVVTKDGMSALIELVHVRRIHNLCFRLYPMLLFQSQQTEEKQLQQLV